MLSRFFVGIRAPIEGLRLIRSSRSLKLLSLIPVSITICLIVFGFYELNKNFDDILIYFLGTKYLEYSTWLQHMIRFLGFVFFSILVFVFSYLFASIIAIPVNSVIADQSLQKLNVIVNKKQSLGENAKSFLIMTKISLVKSVLFFIISFFIFVGSLLPGLSLPMLFFGLMLLAYDCIDFSLELLELNLNQRINYFKNHIPEISGFALFLGILFFIPVLNVALLPIAIAGGAYIVSNSYDKK